MPQKKNSKAKKTGKCHVCGDTGHYARDCEEKKSGSEEVVLQDTTGKCHVCGETGHYARECKDKKSDTVKVVLQDTTRKCHLCGYTGHYARECKGKVVLKEIIGFGTRSNKKAQGWYLYFGSSAHVCYSRDMFVDYNPKRNHEVILDNNDRVDVAGIGTVVLRFTTGKVLTLSNVLHIPQISQCLVSVPKLDVLGYIMSLGSGGCVIKKSNKLIGEGCIEDGASPNGDLDLLSSLFRLSLIEERVEKVVLDKMAGLLLSNEHPELTKVRAQGWYLFSRCTIHVCNSRDMFVEYEPVTGYEVVLENNSPVDVVGFGTVKLQLTTGKVLTLENVFHIPKIIKCCISVGELITMGLTVGFSSEGCDIKKGNKIIGIGYVEDELYRLSVVDEHPSADYDPVINHEVNLDIDDHADVARIGKSALSITCGGGEYVIKLGGVVAFKGYHDGVLYKNNLMLEPPLAKVVHHETIGIGWSIPSETKSGARGWYLLSRSTMHVCNLRDMFVDYQPVTGHEVVLENYSRLDVVGFGTVKLQFTTGNVLTLENVFHIPEFIRCCISMNKLLEMGLGVGFDAQGCYVKKGQQIVGNGFIENGLFRLGVIDERSGGNQA
ncbi:hypothetical protein CTI12_AA314190 [Artemisia annua]|uniref:CCHC-type domain-containing protein n=1 Tax=Artemisia annua TaxID=35608 RepID=A0A2U1N2P8_ARTAN|nr:hypothetical protein CTI12_AA314190 [Artemisia annua]